MKYLYVLASDASDVYLEQTILSITSLRIHNNNPYISLLVDDKTNENLTGSRGKIRSLVNELVAVNIDESIGKTARSRWLKTSMRQHIKEDFLYIDSDTIISGDLSPVFDFDMDLGGVLDDHVYLSEYAKYRPRRLKMVKKMFRIRNFNFDFRIYFNGGVFFSRDNQAAYDFFNAWHNNWLHCFELNLLTDQASLNKTNFDLGNPIKELDGIWNCQLMHDGALKYIHDAKILHYFTTHIQDKFFLLANKEHFQSIKDNGEIAEETIDMLKNPKAQFATHTRIMLIDPSLNDYYDSAICGAAKRIFHTRFGSILEFFLAIIKKNIFTPLRKRIFLGK